MARFARAICVWAGVALAVWLRSASIHIVEWTADGPERVALLPPRWQLAAIVVGAALVAAALSAWEARDPVTRTKATDAMNPLALLWLWVIPYLPWIPDRAPTLLVLAGPLRWGVLALALAGSAAALLSSRPHLRWVRWPGRRTIGVVSFAIYVGFGLWSAATVGPGADEPHYLVITQSLLRDHDLAIENNHVRGDYREYFGGELRPDFLRRGLNEVIYSIHAPGLPALLVPAYAVGGYRGAVVTMCLFGALAAMAIFDLATLLAGPAAAWATWAAICLTVPFVPHSWLIFPEMPGALIVAWAALWLYAPLPSRESTWIWRGAALAILPWLHTKFVILLAAMAGALLLRIWRQPKAAIGLVTPAIVSGALWVYSFYALYGVFDPQIPYGDFPKIYVLFSNIPRGVLGLLFDQKFGLLVYAPVYLIAIAGCWRLLRRSEHRCVGAAMLATIVAFVASSTRMYMWWGGSSAPARFLVPVLPLAGPMIALAFDDARSAARTLFALLLIVSLALALAGVVSPQRFMLFSAPHGLANLVTAVQGPSPLSFLLPTFTEDVIRAPLALLMPWMCAAVIALIIGVMLSKSNRPSTGVTASFSTVTVFLLAGAILAGAPLSASQRRATALRGRFELMRDDDGAALRSFDYLHARSIDGQQLPKYSAIHLSRASGDLATDGARFAGPLDFPAGRFVARITFGAASVGDGGGSVFALMSDRVPIASIQPSQTATMTFDVPVDAPVSLTASDETLASAVQEIDIVAESIVPRHARPNVELRAVEAIAGRPGASIIYGDDETYPEGGVFWTRGTHTGTVFIVPAGASTLVLTLHVGPVAGRVQVMVGNEDRSVTLTPDQTRRLEVPLPAAARLVPITVAAPGRFRPSDHDPGSADGRWLGCQVRVELR